MENNFENDDGLKITQVKPDTRDSKYKKVHPHLPQSPYVLGLFAPRQTGKSTVISWLMLHESALGQDMYKKVYIFSPCIEQCSTSRFLRQRYECDSVYTDAKLQGIIDEQKKSSKEDMGHICVIFDDCIGDASMKKTSLLTAFVTKSRHFNADIILSLQHFKSLPKISRSNLTDVLIGYPIPNKKMLEEMCEEFSQNFENGKEDFYKYYYEATDRTRYNFMNMKLNTNPIQVFSSFGKRIK